MDKLKKFGFTGYLMTKLKREDYLSEGYLVFKDGNLDAAIYGRRTDGKLNVTGLSEEGLKFIWADSYDTMCDLEVHGRLDINIILQSYPASRLNPPVVKKVTKRRTRFSLEWGNNGQEAPKEAVEKLPDELKVKIEEWRNLGYVVKFLQEEIERDPGNAVMAIEQYENNIKRAEFLKQELERLDCREFRADVERLKAMIKNPSKITAIEASLQGLKLKIEQERQRLNDERIAKMMAEKDSAQPAVPEPAPQAAPSAVPPRESEEIEEKLAGYGDIMPPKKEPGNACTICGAELYGKEECPTCGADNSKKAKDPIPVGDSNLIPEYTFDNFILGESNMFSHSAAMAVSKPGTSTYNPLFICGTAGLGKTHLLNAIGNFVIANYPDNKVLLTTAEGFANEFLEANRNNRKKQFRKKYRELDFILIDDIHGIAGQDIPQEELYLILSALFKEKKQIVITCDRPIRDVTGMKERLVSLFDAGIPTEILPADIKTGQAILRLKVRAGNIEADDDVLNYIASRHGKNVRTLEGALKTLAAYSNLMKAPINLETARLALKDENSEARDLERDIEPAGQVIPMTGSALKLKLSHSYLVEEDKPVKCFEYFVDNLNLGMRGMALTRVNPKRLKDEYDMGGAAVLWLTDKDGDAENRVMPVLEKIIYRIEDFLNTPGKSILLMDGLDYLISNNSFDSVLKFLRRLIDEVSESEAIFMMSLTPETIDEQGLNILEREMEIISFLQNEK